jgi:hypothetical protein
VRRRQTFGDAAEKFIGRRMSPNTRRPTKAKVFALPVHPLTDAHYEEQLASLAGPDLRTFSRLRRLPDWPRGWQKNFAWSA